ncbi:hypothetical protein [Salinimicrobium sp. GXAS 041]|uniref:hypothetical protein n=1 Tax=Salinimicrobium sp. GXAS 041 TaxID=3400806 RepID=UPI003C75F31E
MIRKLKKEIKRFVDARVNLIKDQQRKNQQTHFNYSQLSQLFSEDSFIPFSAWAISPNTILHVLNDISINQRKGIVEFGAGASTFYIAKLLKVLEIDAVFFSVESDEKWAKEIRRHLELYQLENYVKIVYAPLEEVTADLSYKEQKIWYCKNILQEEFQSLTYIDLVLVDGPFGGSTPYARYSAIPFLQKKLPEDCSIYLDDVNRPHEEEIAKEWKLMLKSDSRYIDRYVVLSKAQKFDVTPFHLESLPL